MSDENENVNGNGEDNQGGGMPVFDDWIAEQPDDVREMLESHTSGLKSALDTERESRKDLQKQLRDLAENAEAGSDAQNELTAMADKLDASDRKAAFYEAAHANGVNNLKLAYLVATQDELFDKKGNPDFDAMKTNYPQLFGSKTVTAGNAGSGTETEPPASASMDDFIRTQAGTK